MSSKASGPARRAIVIVAVLLAAAAAAFTAAKVLRPPPPVRVEDGAPFSISSYRDGRLVQEYELTADAALWAEVRAYVESPGAAKGERVWFTSYAPGLTVTTERVRINFLERHVVVSVRDDAGAVWRDRERAKSPQDAAMEERIRALLQR